MREKKLRFLLICCAILLLPTLVVLYIVGPKAELGAYTLSQDEWRSKLIDEIKIAATTPDIPLKVLSAPRPPELENQTEETAAPYSEHDLDIGYQLVPAPIEMKKVERTRPIPIAPKDPILKPWLNPTHGIEALIESARIANRSWSFGWLQLAHPVDISEMASRLAMFDAEFLGSAGQLVRVRLPQSRDQLEQITALSWVSGIGVQPPEHKISEAFATEIKEANPSESVPVFITLMGDGQPIAYRKTLTELGLTVGHYDPTIRVVEAVVPHRHIWDLLANDFIQSIEPIGIAKVSHESAVPAMGVDALRTVTNLAGTYSGVVGRSVPIAVMDTGLNTNHIAISSLRQSICGANFVDGEDHDLWVDAHGHGTHVTGTMAGNGFNQPAYAGMAPGVQHIRFAKVLGIEGFGSDANINRGMDFLATASACPDSGWSEEAVKPLIVNMSLGGSGLRWEGRSSGPRKLDSKVWSNKQLYVVANSNANIYGFSDYASAKNSLSVGAAWDSGDLATFSSIGPTRDGRLIPNIVGTGVNVVSTLGSHSRDAYYGASGTSMSSPSVAGVAALLMDAVPEHREQPALVRARLLASAIKPNAWLDSSDTFPRNNSNGPGEIQNQYGLGKVSARTSILNRTAAVGWVSGSAITEMTNDEYAYVDIEVPENASRLDIVLTWDEPPTDTISRAVLNDLNLWVDVNADCAGEECGEYASESKIDNFEWVIISNPKSGSYRLKVTPKAVYTQPPRAAVAWTIIRGDAVPQLSIETDRSLIKHSGTQSHEMNLWLTSSSYVAAGTRLHVDCRTYEAMSCGNITSISRDDGIGWYEGLVDREDKLVAKAPPYLYIPLGEIVEGERQRISLKLDIPESTKPVQVYFTATAWNGQAGRLAVAIEPADYAVENEPMTQPTVPTNDDFRNASLLTSQAGVIQIDTLLSSSEDGEPVTWPGGERPANSVWYRWVAEASGLVGFSVNPLSDWKESISVSSLPNIEVFEGPFVSGLQTVAGSTWSAQFFAEQDKTYYVRVSHRSSSLPMILQWFTGARPKNDDFRQAIALEGDTGSVSGTNLGATIEPGENFGDLASSVWWRWTAPRNGIWQFQVNDASNLVILAFKGNRIEELRLVSSFKPGDSTAFPVREGEEYFILLASTDAYQGGSTFDALTWSEFNGDIIFGDMFSDAERMEIDEGEHSVTLATSFTVEPYEPQETGIRTSWLIWTAGKTSTYTWKWDDNHMLVSVFSGHSLSQLQRIASGGGVASQGELVFSAKEGEMYRLSFGLPQHSNVAFDDSSFYTTLRWGHTPSNDRLESAEKLLTDSGTTAGTTVFATTEADGRARLGYDSVWYTLTPTESTAGWYKFWIDDPYLPLIISVFHKVNGAETISLLNESSSQRLWTEGAEVILQLDAGVEYFVRIGNTKTNESTQFTLNWDRTMAPQWLRYVGRFADGWRDPAGRITSLSDPHDLEFNTTGSMLFVGSTDGLLVFNRDPSSGLIELESRHSEITEAQSVALQWDPHRDQLYIVSGCEWWVWTPKANPTLTRNGVIGPSCVAATSAGAKPLFMGEDGNYLYHTASERTFLYQFTKSGSLEHAGNAFESQTQSYHVVHRTADGGHWFIVESDSLSIYSRRNGTGQFENSTDPQTLLDLDVIASLTDEYIFAHTLDGWWSLSVGVYETDDDLTQIEERARTTLSDLELQRCLKSVSRTGSHTIDILCSEGAVVVEYMPNTSEVVLRDYLNAALQSDRYGNLPPRFSLYHHWDPVEASPDGRHIYLTTNTHGILIFERIGNVLVEALDTLEPSHKRLDLLQIEYDQVHFGNLSKQDGCLEFENERINNSTFTINHSKWQERQVGTDWEDIQGSEQSKQLCSLRTTGTKEFRLIAEIEIDGESGNYASNFIGGQQE